MRLLEKRILADGKVRPGGVLKVDGFLNHQMDIALFRELAEQFYAVFGAEHVTKVLTIEASGIGLACMTGDRFGCPVLFAKKSATKNIAGDVYRTSVHSYTHGNIYDVIVSKDYLLPGDRVLLVDDFLANGAALDGLCDLVSQAGATLVGAGIAIEKTFQPGGARLRESGIVIESLAKVSYMDDEGNIRFEPED